ncbi:Selenocysteine insertion sequence-binding protein 2-like [Armadillidium vulgare]|nr:Selenocysteine insertion sequence-binding protein 2-like [Armadillidium vulgare]
MCFFRAKFSSSIGRRYSPEVINFISARFEIAIFGLLMSTVLVLQEIVYFISWGRSTHLVQSGVEFPINNTLEHCTDEYIDV